MINENPTPQQKRGKNDNIIDGVILSVVSLILALILFGAFGKAGDVVANSLCGVFGYAIYGITFAMLTIGILRFCNYTPNARVTTIVGATLIFVFFIMIFQVVTAREYLAGYGSYLKSCYQNANTAGGALFGLIVYPIAKLNYIFALVILSLLSVGAVILTFFVQITKMPIFKANTVKIRDRQLPLNKIDNNYATQDIESGLNIELIDGTMPNNKISKARRQSGHEAIHSIEELDKLAQRDEINEDVVVVKKDTIMPSARVSQTKPNLDLLQALEDELPPPSIDEVNSAINLLNIQEKKKETPKPIDVNKEFTKEYAASILYDPNAEIKPKKKVEFNEIDRTYTNNARLEELERNLGMRKRANAEDTPSVSQQINNIFKDKTDNQDYFARVEEDDLTQNDSCFDDQKQDTVADGGADIQNSANDDFYEKLKNSKPIDLTAKGHEPLESFEDKLKRQEDERLAQEQENKAKARTFKDELLRKKEERARKERADKGGTHVTQSTTPDFTPSSFGTGVNFGLPNIDAPMVKQPQTNLSQDKKERTAVVAPPSLPYKAPHIALLNNYISTPPESEDFSEKVSILEQTFQNFGIDARVVNIVTGPTFTRMELQMPAGISVSKINAYAGDIAMCLEAESVRLQTPIPGKNLFGVELPNKSRGVVGLKDLFNSASFNSNKHAISFAIGQDCDGRQYVIDLAKAPHMLIAGATGAGKSVCINTLICSIIYKYSPSEVKIALVDPKQVELSRYNGLPHMLVEEAIYDKDKVVNLLDWTIDEMEARYALLKSKRSTGIAEFNEIAARNNEAKLPYIVVIIDEVADIVLNLKKEFEERVVKIAQKARAAGIVLILATQRPSVDVITGIIKANLPSRIAFAVASQVDSKTIIDSGGAEKLLRNGDMLYVAGTDPKPVRIQGAFVSNDEVNAICEYVRNNNEAEFDDAIAEAINRTKQSESSKGGGGDMAGISSLENDKMFVLCLKHVIESGDCSSSMLMRRFSLGFPRAARIVDAMIELGYVAKNDNRKYEVCLTYEEFMSIYGDFDLS